MNQSKAHLFVGTPGKVTLHTLQQVWKGDQISIGKQLAEITEIVTQAKSHYHLNHNFYELQFKLI